MRIMKSTLLLFGLVVCMTLRAGIEFPRLRGWNIADSTKLYDSETLWEYIDGAAESYLNYNFRQLEVMEYSRSSDIYIKVEVYRQGSAMDAFGIYAFERPQEAEFLELGCEGYIIYSSLNLYVKNYYIKILSHQDDEKTITAIRTLGEKVAALFGEDIEKPLLLDLMPDYDKIPQSEKYYSTNFLGYSFLNNAIVADYLSNGSQYQMFIIVCDSTETALNTLSSYFKQTKTNEQPVTEKIYDINDVFNGYIFLSVVDRFLLGTVNLDNKEFAHEYLTQFADFVFQSGIIKE